MNKWAKQQGFTIVELLIVIVVIAILAAITIAAYNDIQNRANDTAVQSDLASLAKQFELYKVDNGTYPPSSTELEKLEAKVTKSAYLVSPNTTYNLVPCLRTGSTEYVIAAQSKTRKRFYIGSGTSGVKEFTGNTDWTGTNGYSVPCADLLPGSSIPSGSCSTIGFCSSWRPWLNN